MDDYVEAALNKVRIARRHLELLNLIREGREEEQVNVQLHFEGLIGAGSSAGDQLAEALATQLGLRIRTNSPLKLLAEIGNRTPPKDLAICLKELRSWVALPIVIDAHKRRRLAVHHHYVKTPNRLLGSWTLDVAKTDGAPSPYDGPLDVHSYAAAYVRALDRLEASASCLRKGHG